MDVFRRNPYTYKVTQCHLSFTTKSKDLFWKNYNEGMAPKDILPSLGYAPDLLGENIRMHIKEEFEKQTWFNSSRRPHSTPNGTGDSAPVDPADKVRPLRNEMEYLRQGSF